MVTTQPGPLALVGSGEYLPIMAEVEGSLIAGRAPRYVQLATAAVPDGPEVVKRWHDLGLAQAERLGVQGVILAVNDRSDAERSDLAAQVAGAGLIYLSGGNPAYLAETFATHWSGRRSCRPGGREQPSPVAAPGPWP